ncbi:uncharacterized protein SCHCODRAFT_02616771 [Schizophyllum commune H4-8]|uniref:uncharacterized protein n=1 Tax=Schizophyllum commune (strain H4-8 / FGSC 9210) TaxID=578458 RepID=UPI002160CF96|nr:uncharacterized protein SCHCODRAFT_02616771 [Schizophyllum commune H4-8]KAI5897124.1 hypothetical protein SCHCODRAFT_02616771 [Schizophyllum commune H4-8]
MTQQPSSPDRVSRLFALVIGRNVGCVSVSIFLQRGTKSCFRSAMVQHRCSIKEFRAQALRRN